MIANENSYLYLDKGVFLFIGQPGELTEHIHHGIEILFGLEDSVKLRLKDLLFKSPVLAVETNRPHSHMPMEGSVCSLVIESQTSAAFKVRRFFNPDCFIADLGEYSEFLQLRVEIRRMVKENKSIRSVYEFIIFSLGLNVGKAGIIDERINRIKEYLKNQRVKKSSLKALAEISCLSEGRLTHIFKEQTGISLRRYQLWLRMIDSVQSILKGSNPSDAAYAAGFADYAHLSRTFRKMFGLSLGTIFNKSQKVVIEAAGEFLKQ